MKQGYFKIVVGAAIIIVHAVCFIIIFYFKNAYLTMSQKTDMALLFMPITAAYAVAVVRSALEHGQDLEYGPRMNLNYSIIVILVTLVSLGGILFTVINITGAAPDDRRQILLFQIAFGALFGLIASDLFGATKTTNEIPRDLSERTPK